MKALFSIIIILSFATVAFAQAGELDSTFDADGIIATQIGNNALAYSVVIQSDGKIVVAGYADNDTARVFALARYIADGSLDSSFGTDGKITTAIGSQEDGVKSLAIQPDGKIVAAGFSRNGGLYDFALARYNTDGTLDNNFSTDGKVTTAIALGDDYAYSVAIQLDGKIVTAGYSDVNTGWDFALVRYNTDGSPDSSFGTDGKVTTDISSTYDYANSLAIQSDGKIVTAGFSIMLSTDYDFALVRYNIDGSLDSSFGADGKVTTDIGTDYNLAYSMAIQSDGKIVAAGTATIDMDMAREFALARYNTDGTLDNSFGTAGLVTTYVDSTIAEAYSVAIQPDMKIVAAGSSPLPIYYWFPKHFALVRYNNNGSLDSSFGSGGKVTTDIGNFAEAYSVAIQSDGKIIAAGSAITDTIFAFALARYISDLSVGIADFSSLQISPLIYPNPIQQTEIFKYTLTNDELITLNLYDVNGRLIKTFFTHETRQSGQHTEELNFENLAAGNYLLTVSNCEQQVSVKIVKQ